MTLEEAIQHCRDVEKEKHYECTECMEVQDYRDAEECTKCAEEHKQLAEWLTELKQRRDAEITASPKTNGDRIRQMTDEELADVMQGQCTYCAYRLNRCADKECKDGVYEWLKQEENGDERDSKAGYHLREILNRIEQDVRRGLWFDHKHTDTVVCSECGHVFTDETPYCPHCGAKMNMTNTNAGSNGATL